jgi:hypothetical protein
MILNTAGIKNWPLNKESLDGIGINDILAPEIL